MKDAQCGRCGLLTIRDEYNDKPCEATHDARQRGRHKSSMGNLTPAKVFCYASSSVFSANVPYTPDTLFRILSQQVDCDSFIPYRAGKSPKEHEEMDIVEKVQLAATDAQNKQDAFYRKYLRVMWFTVIAAIASGIISGLLSGWLSVGHRVMGK